jgi:hypothetical protein
VMMRMMITMSMVVIMMLMTFLKMKMVTSTEDMIMIDSKKVLVIDMVEIEKMMTN